MRKFNQLGAIPIGFAILFLATVVIGIAAGYKAVQQPTRTTPKAQTSSCTTIERVEPDKSVVNLNENFNCKITIAQGASKYLNVCGVQKAGTNDWPQDICNNASVGAGNWSGNTVSIPCNSSRVSGYIGSGGSFQLVAFRNEPACLPGDGNPANATGLKKSGILTIGSVGTQPPQATNPPPPTGQCYYLTAELNYLDSTRGFDAWVTFRNTSGGPEDISLHKTVNGSRIFVGQNRWNNKAIPFTFYPEWVSPDGNKIPANASVTFEGRDDICPSGQQSATVSCTTSVVNGRPQVIGTNCTCRNCGQIVPTQPPNIPPTAIPTRPPGVIPTNTPVPPPPNPTATSIPPICNWMPQLCPTATPVPSAENGSITVNVNVTNNNKNKPVGLVYVPICNNNDIRYSDCSNRLTQPISAEGGITTWKAVITNDYNNNPVIKGRQYRIGQPYANDQTDQFIKRADQAAQMITASNTLYYTITIPSSDKPPPSQNSEICPLTVEVRDSTNDTAVKNVTVSIYNYEANVFIAKASAKYSGVVIFNNIIKSNQKYSMKISAEGYKERQFKFYASADAEGCFVKSFIEPEVITAVEQKPAVQRAMEKIQEVIFNKPPEPVTEEVPTAISGKVKINNSVNKTIEVVYVSLYDENNKPLGPNANALSGSYSFDGLEPKDYIVKAWVRTSDGAWYQNNPCVPAGDEYDCRVKPGQIKDLAVDIGPQGARALFIKAQETSQNFVQNIKQAIENLPIIGPFIQIFIISAF